MRMVVLGGLFFAIGLGLGYPSLNRYDPRRIGTLDTNSYYGLVVDGPSRVEGFQRYRVLTPLLARPIYHLAQGRLGTWNPVFFGLLVVNSAFVSMTCLILIGLGLRWGQPWEVCLTGACLYLLNFEISNGSLVGMVDAGEAFCLIAGAWAVTARLWLLLPIVAVIGGMQKETFVPLGGAMLCGWWVASGERKSKLAWVAASVLSAMAAVLAVRAFVAGHIEMPWHIVKTMDRPGGLVSHVGGLFGPQIVYVFGWLLPLALPKLKVLPRQWIIAVACASCVAVVLGVYNDSGGNIARPLFNITGPLLCLSAAALLVPRSASVAGIPTVVVSDQGKAA